MRCATQRTITRYIRLHTSIHLSIHRHITTGRSSSSALTTGLGWLDWLDKGTGSMTPCTRQSRSCSDTRALASLIECPNNFRIDEYSLVLQEYTSLEMHSQRTLQGRPSGTRPDQTPFLIRPLHSAPLLLWGYVTPDWSQIQAAFRSLVLCGDSDSSSNVTILGTAAQQQTLWPWRLL